MPWATYIDGSRMCDVLEIKEPYPTIYALKFKPDRFFPEIEVYHLIAKLEVFIIDRKEDIYIYSACLGKDQEISVNFFLSVIGETCFIEKIYSEKMKEANHGSI